MTGLISNKQELPHKGDSADHHFELFRFQFKYGSGFGLQP